uniref:thioesterase II family protein n=1 Tax=Nonomuraea pusilla TaxID=46177 RepID=UPI0006E39CEE|nr:alpha/beta fold hydrolase [Nonomuraea pusilla]
MAIMTDRWLIRWQPRTEPALRLICFPYAGGGPALFRTWPQALPPQAEVCAVQLPGRGARFTEPPFTSMDELLPALADGLAPFLDRPYVTFGHSLGGIISFELVRFLRAKNLGQPELMIISGCRAAQAPPSGPRIHDLPTAEFRAELRRINGTPQEVLEDEGLLEVVEPMVRADMALGERYLHLPEPPLDVPMSVVHGSADATVTRAAAEAWHEQTTGEFVVREVPGDHFFIHDAEADLLPLVRESLRPWVLPSPR